MKSMICHFVNHTYKIMITIVLVLGIPKYCVNFLEISYICSKMLSNILTKCLWEEFMISYCVH